MRKVSGVRVKRKCGEKSDASKGDENALDTIYAIEFTVLTLEVDGLDWVCFIFVYSLRGKHMRNEQPSDYLQQGETLRIISGLSTTSKEVAQHQSFCVPRQDPVRSEDSASGLSWSKGWQGGQ
jgi:hypothetical protein